MDSPTTLFTTDLGPKFVVKELKVCEHCGVTFIRIKGSGIRFCPRDRVPFSMENVAPRSVWPFDANMDHGHPSRTIH